jgi:hypothetical protein
MDCGSVMPRHSPGVTEENLKNHQSDHGRDWNAATSELNYR